MISVIICTYNREKYLGKAIRSLIDQKFDKKQYEIIIIDNNSTDNTSKVVKKIIRKNQAIKIRLYFEKKQGLGYARNRGIICAMGDYITYLDDDAVADENWLRRVAECFKNNKDKPLAIGGRILPLYEKNKPDWFRDSYESFDLGDKGRVLRNGESFSGSNMVFKKETFKKFGLFHTEVGMKGEIVSVGEETSIFEDIWKASNSSVYLFYCPELIIHHTVSEHKMTVYYRLTRSYISGHAKYIRNKNMNTSKRIVQMMRYICIFSLFSVIVPFRLIISLYIKRGIVDAYNPIFYSAGYLAGQLGVNTEYKKKK